MSARNAFALIVRTGLNEASVVDTGTKKAMVAAGESIAQKEFDFIGVARTLYSQTDEVLIGELVHTIRYVDAATETEATSHSPEAQAANVLAVQDLGGQDVADAIVASNVDRRTEMQMVDEPSIAHAAPKVAPVAPDTLQVGDKVRLTPKGGKFSPIVLVQGVCVIDGVESLVGHDVEYDKERTVVIDSIATWAVKVKRYMEIDASVLNTLPRLPERKSDDERVADVVAAGDGS